MCSNQWHVLCSKIKISLSEWVTRSPIELFWTAKNTKTRCTVSKYTCSYEAKIQGSDFIQLVTVDCYPKVLQMNFQTQHKWCISKTPPFVLSCQLLKKISLGLWKTLMKQGLSPSPFSISDFPTPLGQFHFHPFPGLIWWVDLRPCHAQVVKNFDETRIVTLSFLTLHLLWLLFGRWIFYAENNFGECLFVSNY